MELHINTILTKYGLSYLESPQDKIPIEDLFKEDTKIFEGHNRHEGMLRIMESLLQRNRKIFSLQRIRELAWEQNTRVCQPPLDEKEFERQWKDALKFIRKKSNSHASCGSQMKNDCNIEHDMVVNMTNYLTSRYSFVTMKDSSEIFYYENGGYVRNGEVEIKIKLEEYCPSIRTFQVNEIIEKIKRITYRNRSDFDVDTNIINLKNGLLNLVTREFRQHSSDYLSTTQLPVNYDPSAKCPDILQHLAQVLNPKNVFTIFQFLGYCLYRSARFKKALMCVGVGIEKLTTDSELSGLLNLALIGLRKLIDDGGFVNAGDVYEVQKEYESSTNSVKNFIEANCITGPSNATASIVCKDLYIAYTNYCKIRKITPLKDNSFGAHLMSLGIRKERRMIEGLREYLYVGVELKSENLPSILKNP